jgi:hypothetical protein
MTLLVAHWPILLAIAILTGLLPADGPATAPSLNRSLQGALFDLAALDPPFARLFAAWHEKDAQTGLALIACEHLNKTGCAHLGTGDGGSTPAPFGSSR